MSLIELLAPAGDKESLVAAIQNGANAVYLGGTLFNARTSAKNFDNEQLRWAVEYAHLRDVKIYVTVNILFKDCEFDQLISYLDYLYDIQIDALIIQDIGLFDIIRKRYDDFEIHISTQASVMNSYGVQYFEEKGASRIVLARENSLDEIKNICLSTSLEIEVFIHGALCVCYSGQCLMSSFIGGRSGNRGACAQPCRLQYRLLQDNQFLKTKYPFLLSPKDLMTIENIGELIDAGVTSFKIEGRMKRPEYVASVVRAYRKAIDAHIESVSVKLDDDILAMKAMFNRNYTKGYAFFDKQLVDGDYPGHKGKVIGEVISYRQNTKRVSIKLNDTLNQEDSIVFETIDKGRPVNKMFLANKLVSCAYKNDIIEIEFDYPVYEGNVRKTVDVKVIENMRKTYQDENVHLPIYMNFEAKINQYARLQIRYNDIIIDKQSSLLVEKALKTPLDKDRIIQQLSKLGRSSFCAKEISVDLDTQMTLPIKEINALRREAVDELSDMVSKQMIHSHSKKEVDILYDKSYKGKKKIYVLVNCIEQLKSIVDSDIDMIYYPFQSDIEEAYQLCMKHNKELGIQVSNVIKDDALNEIINHSLYSHINKLLVNDYGAMHLFQDKDLILGTGLNIYNSYSSSYYDLKKILSLEMTHQQMNQLKTNREQCIIQVYGKTENMISNYCPISQHYLGYQNKNCQICKKSQFSLIDRKNEKFDIMMDEKCRMHLLNCKTLFIDQFDKVNVSGLFIHFTNETCSEVKDVIDYFISLNNQTVTPEKKMSFDITLGYFNR